MAEALRIAAVLLLPVMPTVGAKILTLLGAETPLVFEGNLKWSSVLAGKSFGAQEILFPRPSAE